METARAAAGFGSHLQPLQRVYLLHGADDRLKDEAIDTIRAATVDPSYHDFDSETLDAFDSSAETILAAANQVPFASPRRMVIVRTAELYRRREKQSDAEQLAVGIPLLGESACLVLRAGAGEDGTRKAKTILTTALDSAIRSAGIIHECAALSAEGLIEWLIGEARRAGKDLEEDAAEGLIHAARGDRIALGNELEKAICYAGQHHVIALNDVEAVCAHDAEDMMFKLVDAVSRKDADRSLTLLHECLRYDSKAQGVAGRLLALLGRQLRLLWQARELSARRVEPSQVRNLPPEIADDLPSEGGIASMAWKAGDLFRAARHWDRTALSEGFRLLLECDLNNKGGGEGSEDVVTNLEVLIVRLCGAGA